MLIAGLSLNGVGSGITGIALIAVPELIPNRYRHIGVVLADSVVYIMIVIGPIAGRFAVLHGDERWRYLYWVGFIIEAVATIGLFFLYRKSPIKHIVSDQSSNWLLFQIHQSIHGAFHGKML